MKYARLELERRYWLSSPPAEIDPTRGFRWIDDRYLLGTRMRLRRISTPGGEVLAHKLCLKEARADDPPSHRRITNLYSNAEEYAKLSVLEARELRKRRYPYDAPGGRFGIDVFAGELEGLVLAEIEFGSQIAFDTFRALPAFAECEVSDDLFFTGGNLAAIPHEVLAARLTELRSESKDADAS